MNEPVAEKKSVRTVREEAQRRGVTLSYMYHLIWAGKVQATKRDGRWVVLTENQNGQ